MVAVAAGTADRALLPVESAVEGSVDPALDALLEHPAVAIVGEVVHAVRLSLVARAGVAMADLEVVLSHPQALAQCASALRALAPRAAVRATASTAQAVQAAAESTAPWGAIGTARAAGRYGCVLLAGDVQDAAHNATRFAWLAVAGTPPDAPPSKTSIAFWGAGAQQPGWLVRCLGEFATRGVNLTRIESRPRRDRLGRYAFFVDVDGEDGAGGPVASALAALSGHCEEVRTLGSYAAAGPAGTPGAGPMLSR